MIGATPLQITSGGGAGDISRAWSSEGSQIAFLNISFDRAAIFFAPATGLADERQLADVFPIRYEILGRQLAWSTDGQALAIADKRSAEQSFCHLQALARFVS